MPNTSSPATPSTPSASGPKTTNNPKPTNKQLTLLRRLAVQTGTSFAYPATKCDASREINRLMDLARSSDRNLEFATMRRERRDISTGLTERPRDATAIRDDEVTGWGSSAHWA
jgi:hypothetical protein